MVLDRMHQDQRLILFLCVQFRQTPLMCAAAEGNCQSVELMITSGANLESKDEVGTWMTREQLYSGELFEWDFDWEAYVGQLL